jgi:hypothetical protein
MPVPSSILEYYQYGNHRGITDHQPKGASERGGNTTLLGEKNSQDKVRPRQLWSKL